MHYIVTINLPPIPTEYMLARVAPYYVYVESLSFLFYHFSCVAYEVTTTVHADENHHKTDKSDVLY